MATKNKKDIGISLDANIYNNTGKEVTPTKVKNPLHDMLNSISVNLTVLQLQAEDDSSEHSLANIININKKGIFWYDSTDVTMADDNGGGCIVTSTGKRFKRLVDKAIDARWYGQSNYYFPDIATATTAVKTPTRFIGLEVPILLDGVITTYWFATGITDPDLIVKISETQILDFTIGDGGGNTPVDGTDTYTNVPKLTNKRIIAFFNGPTKIKVVDYPTTIAGGFIYAQYRASTGQIIIKNGTFNTGNDCLIIYK